MSAPTQAKAIANHAPPPRELHDGEALLNKMLEEATVRLETTASRYVREIESADSRLRKTILTARGIEDLRALLSGDVMKAVMAVQNTRLGFLTDKPAKDGKGGYPEPVVRDCVIEGLLKGVYPFNNEWNIIGGNLMIVQNGWRRKLHELPGMDEFPVIEPGDVAETPKYYKVPVTARWVYEGQARSMTRNVFVQRDITPRTNSYGKSYTKDDFTTIDNLMGKIERKTLEAVFKVIKGEVFGELDSEDGEAAAAPAIAEKIAEAAAPAAKPHVSEDEAAELRVADALAACKERGAFDPKKFPDMLRGWFGARTRASLTTVQRLLLAEKLEVLAGLTAPAPAREPGDEGDEPAPSEMFPPHGDGSEAHDERR